jgi:hypothetical protein
MTDKYGDESVKTPLFRRWKTVRQSEPHKVVGTIILWATLLFFGIAFSLLLLHKLRPPSFTTAFSIFCVMIGPFSLWYVGHQNLGLLRWVWKSPWGKLFYGLVASVIVTSCKVLTDQQIRLLIESNPSLFPSAQQFMTVLNIIAVTLSIIGAVLLICSTSLLFRTAPNSSTRPQTSRSWVSGITASFAYMWGGTFIFLMMNFLGFFGNISIFGGKPFNLTEEFLVWSSFIPNDRGVAGSGLVCTNLLPDTLVCPFNTKTPIPNEVVIAQPISTGLDRSGRNYTYHVVACSKPIDPRAR